MLQPSEEIKSRLDIVDVIRDYIQLQAAGVNFRAKCPFHRENSPSFLVSPDKQIWHCFGCGKGGDIFTFVMEMEGLSFAEALRLLAPKAGVTLKRSDPALTSQRNRLLDTMDQAVRFYQEMLARQSEAEVARKYLQKRGLDEDTQNEWQIGYSPDKWEELGDFLKKRGFSENEIFLAGLSVKSQDRPGFYDRFRGRIMFPIRDVNGNTVAFTARVRPDKEATEKMGKYINSPQTMVYDKSRLLFGLDKARQEIKREDTAIIVEGQMDAITAHQFGFKNVVAASGTALTAEQVALLKRYSANIALSFDMDRAGELAAERGIRAAMAGEMNIKVIILPSGKDPDECIRTDVEQWRSAVKNAKPMMEYYFDKTFLPLNFAQVADRRQAAKILLPVIVALGNKIEREFWLKRLAEKIDVSENVLRETIGGLTQKSQTGAKEPAVLVRSAAQSQPRAELLSELLFALVFRFPGLFPYILQHLQTDYISGSSMQSLYKSLLFYYNNIANKTNSVLAEEEDIEAVFNYQSFKSWLTDAAGEISDNQADKEQSLRLTDRLALLAEKEYYELEPEQGKNEALKILLNLKRHFLNIRMLAVEKEIGQAEKDKDRERAKLLMNEFKALSDEIQEIILE